MTTAKILFQNKIEHLNPTTLRPASYNPRPKLKEKNPERFRRLQRSMEQGVFKPILVNRRTGNIVAGHQRVDAAIELGYETVPVLWLDVSEKDEKRINIADNVEWSEFEKEMLQQVLSEEDWGDDLQLFGLNDDAIAILTQDLGEAWDDDDEVELPEQSGLETLRLIFSTDQLKRVMEVIESVKKQMGKSLKTGENPNENGTAAYFVFETFRRLATDIKIESASERSHPALRHFDDGDEDLASLDALSDGAEEGEADH